LEGSKMSRRVWALLAGVSLTACSSTNANDTPKTGDGSSDASVMGLDAGSSDATQPAVTQTVGAAGGTVQTPGAVLTIPAGALSSNVVISVTPDAASVPPEFTAFSPVYRFEPSGTTFLTPVTITLTLTTPAANATVFELNAAGGYDGLVTTTNDTTASAATLRLGDFFAGAPNAVSDGGAGSDDAGPVADSGATDASATADASAGETTSDSGAIDGNTSNDSGPIDAGMANDSAAGDGGFVGITATIDGVPTTFSVNPQVTYQSQIMYTTVQADTGTGTYWRVLLGLTSATTQTCSPSLQPTYPEITYTHYTANVLDATFTTKHLGATCSVTVTATATVTGQHSTGSFTATLDSQSDAGAQSHAFTSGSYDEIF
jgi:hypothetical protein